MPMYKYNLKKKIPILLGFAVSIVCFLGILFFAFLRAEPVNAPLPGQDKIDGLEALHIKGSYKSPYFDFFTFESKYNPSLPFDIKAYFVDETVYCFLPSSSDGELRVTFRTSEERQLFYNGSELKNKGVINVRNGATLYLKETEFTLVPVYTKLPYVSFETMNGNLVYSNGGYVAASGRMWDENYKAILSQLFQIRVRGNLTTAIPKLSYKIKTINEFSIYGHQKSDEWTLLANFYDPSLLRNKVAFDMAHKLGMEYIPQMNYVELYLNGEYHGVYALTSQVGIHSGNVDLDSLKNDLSGSYMLELDSRSEGLDNCFESLFGIPIVLKDPSAVSEQQRDMIQKEVEEFEKALLSEDFTNGSICYRDLIDMKSFADVYLINEILGNLDASAPLSLFVYKNSEGKLAMGPVWDFDLAAGNNSNEVFSKVEGFNMRNYHWFARLNQDPVFCNLVIEEYGKLYDFVKNIDEYFSEYSIEMKTAANNNFISAYIGINSYSNVPSDDPFEKEVSDLNRWLKARFDWIEQNMEMFTK